MEQQTARKSYKYKLKPTPEQEQMLDRTLMLRRHIENAAIGERREAWRMRGGCVADAWRLYHLLPAESRTTGH
jgi:hypothetical protein